MTRKTASTARRRRYREDPAVLDVEDRVPAAGAHLPAGWIALAVQAVRDLEAEGRTFTARDLVRRLPEPVHPAHVGGVMTHLHGRHVIKRVGLVMAPAWDGTNRPTAAWAADRLPPLEDDAADAAAA